MRYRFDTRRGVRVATLGGALTDGPDGRQFCEAVRRECRGGGRRFVVDCGAVERVTPFGLGVLATGLAQVRNVKGTLVLARVPGPLRSLLSITDFRAIFSCYPTVEAAVSALLGEEATPERSA